MPVDEPSGKSHVSRVGSFRASQSFRLQRERVNGLRDLRDLRDLRVVGMGKREAPLGPAAPSASAATLPSGTGDLSRLVSEEGRGKGPAP